MLNLYKLNLKIQVKEAKKRFQLIQSEWPLFEGLANNKEINSHILEFILRDVFRVNDKGIHSKEDFDCRVAKLKNGKLLEDGQELFETIKEVMIERRFTIDHIHQYDKKNSLNNKKVQQILDDAMLQVKRLLSISLFQQNKVSRISLLPRYFKALRIRVERAYVNHVQDLQKWQKIVPFDEYLQQCGQFLAKPKLPKQQIKLQSQVEEFWVMIEEYKVSIFAQELKTSISVSHKRLEKKWQEVLDSAN